MDVEDDFERCVALVDACAARTAKRTADPAVEIELPVAIEPAPATPAHELALVLGLTHDELELSGR
jgi:hypothetical protein